MKYRDWLYEWLENFVKPNVKENTYCKYIRQSGAYIVPAPGDCPLGGITALTLQKFVAGLNARGLSPATVNGLITLLKGSLKKAVLLGLCEREFTDCIRRPHPSEGKTGCFTLAEQRKIEAYILSGENPKLCGIILCLYTGLRIGELLALEWGDVDFSKGTITVSKTCRDGWRNGAYFKIVGTPKTSNSYRTIPVPKQILAMLKWCRRRRRSEYVCEGRSRYGAQVRSYQRTFETLLKKLGIPHRGFHSLRHTFATRALEVGMDVRTLSEILGHNNPAITLKRYAHSLMEHKVQMMNRLGRLFEDKTKNRQLRALPAMHME